MNLKYKIQSQYLLWSDRFDDPVWSWGIRIAISIAVPLLAGVLLHQEALWVWAAIAAECTALIELKGDTSQRIRILLGAILLNVVFAILGGLLGLYWVPALVLMFGVGVLSGLFKNLGEKGSALALSVFVSAIINVSYPIQSVDELKDRTLMFLIVHGRLWSILLQCCLLKKVRPSGVL